MKTLQNTLQGFLFGLALAGLTPATSFSQSTAGATKAAAPAGLEAAVYQVGETAKVKVHLVNHTSGLVLLQIRDVKNQVVYSENVAATNYIRKFDLARLGDGTYRLELHGGRQHVVKEVDIQTVTARTMHVH